MTTDLYDLLEVSPRARKEVIAAAYRELMKVYHPDNPGGDKAVAQKLNHAKAVLLDPERRNEYDKRKDLNGVIIGDFRVIKFIAEGGFGRTYMGEHIWTKAPVCIKHCANVSPQYHAILIAEAKAIWDLHHHGIPIMRTLVKLDDGSIALIMSYIPGPTLEEVVTKVKTSKYQKLEPETVCWITERVINVLRFLHSERVVHGDVKPQNIIIQPENHRIILVDYGLAAVNPSKTSSAKGYTPYFAPPEQISGLPLIPQSDFYALGMTMIYAFGGMVDKKKIPDDVPNILTNFIKRLIQRDPFSRPNWEKEDLFDTFKDIRKKLFGNEHSGMKPIQGL